MTPPTPYLADPDVTLWHGDAVEVLRGMEADSVDCVVTSPPYWALRDYGNDGQLGLEETPDLFVARLVDVFREVRRVLCPHGTCWVNLGDSYAAQGGGKAEGQYEEKRVAGATWQAPRTPPNGLKPKDLVGIPWRVAFALQQDGWWLRSDIVWAKSNPMPESVTDRPTKAHEYVFLLTKQPRYWFDQEAVREPLVVPPEEWAKRQGKNGGGRLDYEAKYGALGHKASGGMLPDAPPWGNPAGRNVRSVWTIATQPYPEAHFATYPEELVRRCVLAGCASMVCRTCGEPSRRIVSSESVDRPDLPRDHPEWRPSRYDDGKAGDPQSPGPGQRFSVTETLGWSDCGHNDWRPGRVLDPFVGSGTTCLVARNHGRHSVGIDLNVQYLELAARRLQQLSLLSSVST